MIFQTYTTSTQTFVGSGNAFGPSDVQTKACEQTQSLSAILMALCTEDENGFFANKKKLEVFSREMVSFESSRMLAKNVRSCKLLFIVSHPAFYSDWEKEEAKSQSVLYGSLAFHSLNKSMKESAFHHVAKALRRDALSNQSVNKPTKLRLRDCNILVAQFMYEYALLSDVNRSIVLAALAESSDSGCGHLPWQQAMALAKKLERSSKL